MSARDVRQTGAEEAVRSDEDRSRCIQAETARYTPPRSVCGGPVGMPGGSTSSMLSQARSVCIRRVLAPAAPVDTAGRARFSLICQRIQPGMPPTPDEATHLNLADILQTLQIESSEPLLSHCWELSESCYPEPTPSFLDRATISASRELGGLPVTADHELYAAVDRITASPPLAHLAWHCIRLLFEYPEYDSARIGSWPCLDAALGELGGAFYLLVALDAVPRIRAVHQRLGIPDLISRDTCRHYIEPVRMYGEHHNGYTGVTPGALYWWRNHVRGDLYRIGRLEYMLKPFKGPVQAFRQRASRGVLALAADATCFDGDGLVARSDTDPAWQAQYRAADAGWNGTPVTPNGRALRRQITLAASEWEPALAPGDTILEVHIPGGGNMAPPRCRESMAQALAFFARQFPDRPAAGFACNSWILNPDLERIYRPQANMVKWQRELYLFPVPSGDRNGVYFVFGRGDIDVETAPRDTSLRRALLDHLAAGMRVVSGGMFLLTEDFQRYGTQVYRRQWATTMAGVGA
jgi:hypothetical protein